MEFHFLINFILKTIIINDPILIGTDKAVLTLENGDKVILEKGQKFQNKTVNSDGKELSYTIKNRSSVTLKMKKLPLIF